jgi:hypothetical protein
MSLLLALLLNAQDPASLISRLASKDEVEAANAKTDLLALGDPARAPLREAAAKEADGPLKRTLLELADRLDARSAARSLPGKHGDLWYSVFKEALHIGWVNLKTEEKDGKLLLSDEIYVKAGGNQVSVKAAQTCAKDEYLSLSALTLAVDTPENQVAAEGEVKADRLVIRAGGEAKAIKLRKNTVTDLAVLRLVTFLPTSDEYAIDLFQLVKVEAPTAARLKQQTEEAIEIDGRLVKAKRWLLSDDGADRTYWVDGRGRLLKMETAEVRIELSDEKRAKDVDVK